MADEGHQIGDQSAGRGSAPPNAFAVLGRVLERLDGIVATQTRLQRQTEAAAARADAIAADVARLTEQAREAEAGPGAVSANLTASRQALQQTATAVAKLDARLARIEARLPADGAVDENTATRRMQIDATVRAALEGWFAEHPERPAHAARLLREITELRDAVERQPATDAGLDAIAPMLKDAKADLRSAIVAEGEALRAAVEALRDSLSYATRTARPAAGDAGRLEKLENAISVLSQAVRGLPKEIARDASGKSVDVGVTPDLADALAEKLARFQALLEREEAAVDTMSDLGEALTRITDTVAEQGAARIDEAYRRLQGALPDVGAAEEPAVIEAAVEEIPSPAQTGSAAATPRAADAEARPAPFSEWRQEDPRWVERATASLTASYGDQTSEDADPAIDADFDAAFDAAIERAARAAQRDAADDAAPASGASEWWDDDASDTMFDPSRRAG